MSELNKRAVSLFTFSKPNTVQEIVKNITEAVKNGEVPPTPVHINMKKIQKVCEAFFEDKEVKDIVLSDAEVHLNGQKTANVFGAKISIAATYTAYDFKGCRHPALDAWNDILKTAKAQVKVLEDELKDFHKEQEKEYLDVKNFGTIKNNSKEITVQFLPRLIYDEVGEVANINPPVKYSKQGLKVTL